MSSRLLSFSLCINLLLLGGVGYWGVRNHSSAEPATVEPTAETNQPSATNSEFAPPVAVVPAPLQWSELESEDYPTYVANLRKAGCPEPVLRRIIGSELKELYAKKAFAFVQEFHRDFWEIAARENVEKYVEKRFGQKLNAFAQEPDALLRELVGEPPPETSRGLENPADDDQFTAFLSPAKQEQLRQLSERYRKQTQAVREGNFSPEECAAQLAQLSLDLEREQTKILSPEELAEYRLRQSAAAKQVQQLYGVDFSETELHSLAKVLDDYQRKAQSQPEKDTDSETLDQQLQALLGPKRFADLTRASSANFRELCEIATDFGRPVETAAEIFDLRLASEKQSDAIRAEKNLPAAEKQALLDALQDQVEQTVLGKFGAEAYQSYKTREGRWINSLGRP